MKLLKRINCIQTSGTSNLIKKADDYNSKTDELGKKITEHDKYVTGQEFTRLKQADLESKSDIANFVKKTDFDEKLKKKETNK